MSKRSVVKPYPGFEIRPVGENADKYFPLHPSHPLFCSNDTGDASISIVENLVVYRRESVYSMAQRRKVPLNPAREPGTSQGYKTRLHHLIVINKVKIVVSFINSSKNSSSQFRQNQKLYVIVFHHNHSVFFNNFLAGYVSLHRIRINP